jgi:hypothetical protein
MGFDWAYLGGPHITSKSPGFGVLLPSSNSPTLGAILPLVAHRPTSEVCLYSVIKLGIGLPHSHYATLK